MLKRLYLSGVLIITALFLASPAGAKEAAGASPMLKAENDNAEIDLAPIVVALKAEKGNAPLHLTLVLHFEFSNTTYQQNFKKNTDAIRKAIARLLSAKTPDDLMPFEAKAALKQEIWNEVSKIVSDRAVTYIRILEFTMER